MLKITSSPQTYLLPLLFFCGNIIFHSCQPEKTSERTDLKLSSEPVSVVRIEQILCPSSSETEGIATEALIREYPVFSDVFFNQVIFPQNVQSIELDTLISHYCASPAIRHLIDTTRHIFPTIDELETKLGTVNTYFEYYFPQKEIPQYFTYVSEFGIGTFTVGTDIVGIGLDFFLGEDYPYYDPSVFHRYQLKTMTPEYTAGSAARALAEAMIPDITVGNMLEFMIRNGKVLYLASRLLPEEPMYRICLYTEKEMQWLQDHELEIWSYLLDLGYFYNNDLRKFQKFIDPGPGTPGLPKEAPGRIANWIGYKIIESYMKQHPEIKMEEMISDQDFQKIMDRSRYKPPR